MDWTPGSANESLKVPAKIRAEAAMAMRTTTQASRAGIGCRTAQRLMHETYLLAEMRNP